MGVPFPPLPPPDTTGWRDSGGSPPRWLARAQVVAVVFFVGIVLWAAVGTLVAAVAATVLTVVGVSLLIRHERRRRP